MVAVVNYLLIIPTAAMGILLYAIRVFYINTGRCIKRIDSLSKLNNSILPYILYNHNKLDILHIINYIT